MAPMAAPSSLRRTGHDRSEKAKLKKNRRCPSLPDSDVDCRGEYHVLDSFSMFSTNRIYFFFPRIVA
jgi:hypothetical protein